MGQSAGSRCWLMVLMALVALALWLPPAPTARAAPLPWRVDELPLPAAGAEQFAPAISGMLVVWSEQRETGAVLRGRNLLTGAAYDVASGRTDPQAVRESRLAPAISGSVVVWQNRAVTSDGASYDRIYARDLAQPDAAPVALATARGGQLRPAIDGTTVVWADNRRGNWDIFGYDLALKREFVVTSRPGDQLWPAISGTVVVWSDESDGVWRIVGKNLSTGEDVSVPPSGGNQTAPAVSGRLVVWEDSRAGRNAFDIYGFDLERQQEFTVSRAADYQLRPVIAGDVIVWEDYRSGERDLWALDYRTGREFAAVTAPGTQWQPALSGTTLVWSDARQGVFTVGAAMLRKGAWEPAAPDPAFTGLWRVADSLVAERATQRTWQWGPTPIATGLEAYAEAPGGKRLVQYYDKSRMEISDPAANRASPWYLTTGHLAKELISGQIQVGADLYEPFPSSEVPVAGDLDSLIGPTYASLDGARRRPAGAVGAIVSEAIDRAGAVRAVKPPAAVPLAYLVPETGHAIAEPFWQYLTSEGPVRRGAATTTGRLFDPTFFATGYPITEPYWTRVAIGGQPTDVLVQAFERRVLTYAPTNAPGWRVEMGNVGRHYYLWRYGTP